MMRASLSLVALAITFVGCGADPDVPPTSATMPTRGELLAATPGGSMFHSFENFQNQVDQPVPAFLRGKAKQIAIGISKPIEGRPKNPDGGTPVQRFGLWHYFYVPKDKPTPKQPKSEFFQRSPAEYPDCAQRGEFKAGRRVGLWRFWYPNGNLRARGKFVDGLMEGEWRVWTEKGTVDDTHSGTYEKGRKAR